MVQISYSKFTIYWNFLTNFDVNSVFRKTYIRVYNLKSYNFVNIYNYVKKNNEEN